MTKYVKVKGTTVADVLNYASSLLNLSIKGKAGNDIVSGGSGNDKLQGNGDNDVMFGGRGTDDIDGGGGTDTAVYQGQYQEYLFQFSSEGNRKGTVTDLIAARDGIDTLKKVEFLQFSNALYDVERDVLYWLNRAPALAAVPGVSYTDTSADDVFAPTSGALSATDPEHDTLSFGIVGGEADNSLEGYNLSQASAYGKLYLDTVSGSYRFVPDDGAIEGLATWTSVTFVLTASDNTLSDSTTFIVTLNGANDKPTTAPVALAAITEDGGVRLITQAQLLANAADADSPSLTATNLQIASGSGELVNNGDGAWSYTPALNDDTSVSFSYTITDGSLTAAGSATLDITSVNDAPVMTAVVLAPVAEDSGPRLITQTQLLANASDVDGPSLAATGLVISSGAGTLVNNGDGSWSYTPALNDDTSVSFSYTVTDGSLTVAGSASVDITSVNDAPTVTGQTTGAVTEDQPSALQTRGNLVSADLDGAATAWSIVGGSTTAQTQDFRFQVDNLKIVKNGSVFFEDSFGDGAPPPSGPNFPPTTGINSGAYTINGSLTEATGRAFFDGTRAVAAGTSNAVRAMLNTDISSASNPAGLKRNADFSVEARFDLFRPQDVGDIYGVRLTDQNSAEPNNDSAVDLIVVRDAAGIQVRLREINIGTGAVSVLEAVTLAAPQGSQIVLRLSYDNGSYIDAANGGSISASFDVTTNGLLVSTASFTSVGTIFKSEDFTRVQLLGQSAQTETGVYKLAGAYGTLTVAQDGQWHYFLADHQPNVQALAQGQQVTDTFTVRASDDSGGLADTQVVITVNGVNDLASIGTPSVADVTEDQAVNGAGNLIATGTIPISDADGQASFSSVVTPFPFVLGNLTLAANGAYTYTVANNAVQFLGVNQTKTETFTVSAADGAQRQVVFLIHGASDNPIALADSNALDPVTEAGVNLIGTGDAFASGNVLFNDTIIDLGLLSVTGIAVGNVDGPVAGNIGVALAGTYGALTLSASNGPWLYQLANGNAATNGLTDGQIVTEDFTYTISDGNGGVATSMLTIAIKGVNDAPSSPQILLPVLEGSGAYQLDLHANVTDPEGDAFHLENLGWEGSPSVYPPGFSLNANGHSFTFNSDDSAFDGLAEGAKLNLRLGYDLVDSYGAVNHQIATLAITGVNDAPSIALERALEPLVESGRIAGALDGGRHFEVAFFKTTDVDADQLTYDLSGWSNNLDGTYGKMGVYGSATFYNGQMSYTLNKSDPDTIALDTGDIVFDNFQIAISDGRLNASTDVRFEIHGRSDFMGHHINYDTLFPADGYTWHDDDAVVTAGIEIQDMSPDIPDSDRGAVFVPFPPLSAIDPGHVDITSNQIIFTFDTDWTYREGFNDLTTLFDGTSHTGVPTQDEEDNGLVARRQYFSGIPFNGVHISDQLNQLPNFIYVAINPLSDPGIYAPFPGNPVTPMLRSDGDNIWMDLQNLHFTAGSQIIIDVAFAA